MIGAMDTVTQEQAVGGEPLGQRERARFFTAADFDGLDCLEATFRTHRYALHTHETYVVGGIFAGCETWFARGTQHYGGPGDLTLVNPEDVHDGAPHGGGYRYRMTYPSVALMRRLASEITGRPVIGTPFFREPVVHDPGTLALFAAAFAAMTEGGDPLAAEELLLRAYGRCLIRHADLSPAKALPGSARIGRVMRLMRDRYAEDLSLDDFAAEAGVSRHHLVRAFRQDMGMTPHAYLLSLRVQAARRRLQAGDTPAEVAAATGFCDQAHLTHAFKARLGVAPGAYRAGLRL
jgi:AraC-like DNA-binding protein